MIHKFTLENSHDAKQLGGWLATLVDHKPMTIFLRGDLGMGKTTVAQGMIASLLKSDVHIPSPTFTYMNRYERFVPIYHFDLYRIEEPDHMYELGLNSLLEDDAAIRIIEWPERQCCLLTPDIDVHLTKIKTTRSALVNFLTSTRA